LKATVLDPCVDPNKVPVTVTVAPTAAGFGKMPEIIRCGHANEGISEKETDGLEMLGASKVAVPFK
jgi:hypothetical protein